MMPVWIGKIERDKGTADIRQSLSVWKNICGRLCSLELSFYRFASTPAHRRTPAKPGTPIPYVPSSPGDLRRRASVGRQSVSCFHTQPVGDTHGSLFTPTSSALRAAVPVLRPVPRLPPLPLVIRPFIKKCPPLIEKSFSVRNRHSRWLSARSSASGLISQGCTEFLRDFTDRR